MTDEPLVKRMHLPGIAFQADRIAADALKFLRCQQITLSAVHRPESIAFKQARCSWHTAA